MKPLPPPSPVDALVARLAGALVSRGWLMATAESCTGGLIGGHCTELAGSSAWFDRGCISYSNAAKMQMLGVPEALLLQHGAVSEAVARAMAEGVLRGALAQCSVAVTGVAGPSGGSPDKPVGTVWMAWHVAGRTEATGHLFGGDRAAVRAATVHAALQGLLDRVEAVPPPVLDWVRLKGLGPQSARLLTHAGIHTRDQLLAADPYRVYLQLQASRPGVSLNLLYALIGALEDTDWRTIARERKTEILMRLDDLRRSASD